MGDLDWDNESNVEPETGACPRQDNNRVSVPAQDNEEAVEPAAEACPEQDDNGVAIQRQNNKGDVESAAKVYTGT